MNSNEVTAIAILKSGRSYDEASKVTGIDFKKLILLYKNNKTLIKKKI
tara:strand:- start:246 stop:389 length:144 start_codon:yes stop_codon:yes gene_type:complete